MTQDTENLTFKALCEIEPKLKDLYDQVLYERKWEAIRQLNLWNHYKSTFTQLVGDQAESTDTMLLTPEAYTVVYDTILSTLTGGRHWNHTGEAITNDEK